MASDSSNYQPSSLNASPSKPQSIHQSFVDSPFVKVFPSNYCAIRQVWQDPIMPLQIGQFCCMCEVSHLISSIRICMLYVIAICIRAHMYRYEAATCVYYYLFILLF